MVLMKKSASARVRRGDHTAHRAYVPIAAYFSNTFGVRWCETSNLQPRCGKHQTCEKMTDTSHAVNLLKFGFGSRRRSAPSAVARAFGGRPRRVRPRPTHRRCRAAKSARERPSPARRICRASFAVPPDDLGLHARWADSSERPTAGLRIEVLQRIDFAHVSVVSRASNSCAQKFLSRCFEAQGEWQDECEQPDKWWVQALKAERAAHHSAARMARRAAGYGRMCSPPRSIECEGGLFNVCSAWRAVCMMFHCSIAGDGRRGHRMRAG